LSTGPLKLAIQQAARTPFPGMFSDCRKPWQALYSISKTLAERAGWKINDVQSYWDFVVINA
jgi:hypothetical protein